MALITLTKEFNIVDPIKPFIKKVEPISVNNISNLSITQKHTLFDASKKAVYTALFMRNVDSPFKNLSDYSTKSTIKILDSNAIKKYNDDVDVITYSTFGEYLDPLFQSLWFLQENYEYSFETRTFIKDDKTYKITNVEIDDDKIKISYQEICEENYLNDLIDNYQYDKDTKTLIIDTDTYKFKDVDCNYSKTKIRTTHSYNKHRAFIFNQDVQGKDNTVVAGTMIDVSYIYPPQLKWSDLKDRSFDVKDTDGNTHSLTVKDADNDNNKISFKEDINYDIDKGTHAASNDDSNIPDKDDKTIDTDKVKDNLKIDYDTELLIYIEYKDKDGIKKCFLTNDQKYLKKVPIKLFGILEMTPKNIATMNTKLLLFNGIYTNYYMKKDNLKKFIGGYFFNPYTDNAVINEYLFNLIELFKESNDNSVSFTIKKDDNNKFIWKFNISKKVKNNVNGKGYYFVKNKDNNFTVYTYINKYKVAYTVSDLEVTYVLNGKSFNFKAKDSTKNILFPLTYTIASKMSIYSFMEILNYSIKYIIILKKNSAWALNYNFNFELTSKIFKSYTKDIL